MEVMKNNIWSKTEGFFCLRMHILTKSGEHGAASCCTGKGMRFCTPFLLAGGWWSCWCRWTHSSLHPCKITDLLNQLNLITTEQTNIANTKKITMKLWCCRHVAIKNTLTGGWCLWPGAQISALLGWPCLRPWKWRRPWGQTDKSSSYPPSLSAAGWPGGTVWTSWAVWTASDGRWCRWQTWKNVHICQVLLFSVQLLRIIKRKSLTDLRSHFAVSLSGWCSYNHSAHDESSSGSSSIWMASSGSTSRMLSA